MIKYKAFYRIGEYYYFVSSKMLKIEKSWKSSSVK